MPLLHCILLLCIVEYLEETPLGFECQYMQWKSRSFTHAYIMGEFALYIQLICYLNSLYKPSQRDCHQLPKWGRLKVHGAPMCGFGN